jgi:hypothetical protein
MAVQIDHCGRCATTSPNEGIRKFEVGCQYNMLEVSHAFKRVAGDSHMYTTHLCKPCRQKLLQGLHTFFNPPAESEPTPTPGKRVVKLMGGDTMEVDEEEYQALRESGLIPMD